MAKTQSFIYVHIPVSPNDPVTTLTCHYDENTVVSCLMDDLKKHFGGIAKPSSAKEAQMLQMKQALEQQGQQVNDDILRRFTAVTMVGQIPLLQGKCTPDDTISVMMYIDDNGQVSNYPNNPRAQQIVRSVNSKHSGPVWGDAFISRYYDNGDDFNRLNFKLEELDSSVEWFVEASKRNLTNASNFDPKFEALKRTLNDKKKEKPIHKKFSMGNHVRIDGLKSRADLNGKLGIITSKYLKKKGRWGVTVDGTQLSIKTENLSKVETAC